MLEGYNVRLATRHDIPVIVQLLSDDVLGSTRETYSDTLKVDECYYKAFDKIVDDRNNELIVMENDKHEVIGTLQITYMTTLTFQGATRAQLEGVRIKNECRGQGLGVELVQWAIQRAKERECRFVQLTTNKLRPEAQHFYKKIGFTDSHIGFKLDLKSPALEERTVQVSTLKTVDTMFNSEAPHAGGVSAASGSNSSPLPAKVETGGEPSPTLAEL